MEQFSLTDIKKKNLSDVYHYIYMNPSCSKQDIATALSVSLPTVSQHLTTLESEQLIEKCGRLSSSVGRRVIRFIEKDISPMKTAQKRKYNLVWFYVLHLSRKRYII